MPLVGFTSRKYPGQVFTKAELLNLLNSPFNDTDFTAAMVSAALTFKGDGPENLTATGLTGTCPREFYFRHNTDYTLELEDLYYALQGSNLHHTLESADPVSGTAREYKVGKNVTLANGEVVFLPGRLDELVFNWDGDKALIRDYKTTKTLPDPKRGPYPLHKRQLAIYRYLLSDAAGHSPQALWDDDHNWVTAPAIDAAFGEMVYISPTGSRRMQFEIDTPEVTAQWLRVTLPDYLHRLVSYSEATEAEGYGMEWKCSFCPVYDACRTERFSIPAAKSLVDDPYAF